MRRRSRARLRSSSRRIPRAAGATRWSTRRTARSSTGSAARSAPQGTRAWRRRLARCACCSPRAQATMLGRADKVDMASAALVNGISSHTFDFDDTHLKTIIHPAGTGRLGGAGACGGHRRQRAAGDRRAGPGHRRLLPRGQHDVSRALRPRLAHHRLHRHARRRCRLRAAPGARTRSRPRWRWASRRRSRSACASSSAP